MNDRQAIKRINLYRKGTLAAFEAFNKDGIKITGGKDSIGDTLAISFKWWPAQREYAEALCDDVIHKIITDKPRQMGATWLVCDWLLFMAMFRYGHEYRIVSIGEDEASKALRKVHFMWEHLPDWCRAELEIDNTTTMKFAATGSWISAIPATKNAGKGDSLNGLLCDEAAYQVYAKEIVDSAKPALEKRGGKLIINSTMEPGTYFAEEYIKAQKGQGGYKVFFFDCWADPNRDQAWYDRELAENGQEYMSLNYPRTWEESLTAKSTLYFDGSRTTHDLKAESEGYIDGFFDGPEFIPKAKGFVRMWEKRDKGDKYVIFADTAEGLPWGDFDNAYVVSVSRNIEVCRIRGKFDPGEYGDMLMEVGEYYAHGEGTDSIPALLAIEANNHGIAVTKHCLEANYRNLYYEHDLKTGAVKGHGRIGWMTNPGKGGTRSLMLGKFKKNYRIGLVKVRDRECLEEMSIFAYDKSGKACAPPGKNDDCVMSRAGAHIVASFEYPAEAAEPPSALAGARYVAQQDIEKLKSGAGDALNQGVEELGG
jgi:hypothetical protein